MANRKSQFRPLVLIAILAVAVSVRRMDPGWWSIPWIVALVLTGLSMLQSYRMKRRWVVFIFGSLAVGVGVGLFVYFVPAIEQAIGR